MIILGIDPGTKISGFGVIESQGQAFKALDFGCIRPPADYALPDRYLVIFNSVDALLTKYRPEALVVETQFVKHNVQSAIKLGMARGAVMIAAARQQIPIYEYAPTKAKLAVVGNGRASKLQVQVMVQKLLRLPDPPHPEDAADALALAICHAHQKRFIK
jgi:crossover junction endodeoxyribonuclease RuvC